MFTSSTQIRVRYAETDQMGVVYHSNYFQYFEVARAESIRNLGFTYADMEKQGVMMPVVEVKCKYIRPALYDNLLTVTANIHEVPNHHKIIFHQEVYNEENQLLVTGTVTLYFLDKKTLKKINIPPFLLDKFFPSHQ
ncbi:MAG: acyl-CoA thioesterase [Chitinophagaceae bacterium]|nr:MAG: acyl-CoA thioesterase [Chitinophagaceae bacterium]